MQGAKKSKPAGKGFRGRQVWEAVSALL